MTKEELDKIRYKDQLGIEPVYMTDEYGTYSTGVFRFKGMLVMVTMDGGKWHASVSAKFPLGYQQIKDIRYTFLPDDMEVAQIFPKREDFVNIHSNCYHLFQID